MLDMSKRKFKEIKNRHTTLLIMPDDVQSAFDFVQELLEAEAKAIKEEEPFATVSISRLEQAAIEVFELGQEIANEGFKDRFKVENLGGK